MTGVSDLPFRRLAHALGAGLVVSEMVASAELVQNRADVLRRAEGDGLTPFVMQLVGCDAHWMAEGARRLAAMRGWGLQGLGGARSPSGWPRSL